MHTGIVLAVEADSELQAIEKAKTFAEGDSANWSDWAEQGGRWDDALDGKSVIRYSDNPEAFNNAVFNFIESTAREVDDYVDHLGADTTLLDLVASIKFHNEKKDDVANNFKNIDDYLKGYRAQRLFNLLHDQFTSDAHFYDTEEFTISRKYLDARIEKEPEKQYLVVWDFHF